MNKENLTDQAQNIKKNNAGNLSSLTQFGDLGFIPSGILTDTNQEKLYNQWFKEINLSEVAWNTKYEPVDYSKDVKMEHEFIYADGGNWAKIRTYFRNIKTDEEVKMKSIFTDDSGNQLYSKADSRIDGTKANSMSTLRRIMNQINWSKVKGSPICFTMTAQEFEENHEWWNSAFKRFRSKLRYWIRNTLLNGNEKNDLLANHDWSDFCGLWVKEYQMKVSPEFPKGRGAIHYHVVFLNAPNGDNWFFQKGNKGRKGKWNEETLNAFGKKMNEFWHSSLYNTKELKEINYNNAKCGQDWEYVQDAEGMISYLSKYLTGSKGQKGQKDLDPSKKKKVPTWVIESETGSRHWGYIEMNNFKCIADIKSIKINMKAYKESKKEMNKDNNAKIMKTSERKGMDVLRRIGKSNTFEVYNVVSIPEPYEGYWKEPANKYKNRYSFLTNLDGSPRIAQMIHHDRAEKKYFLFDANTGEKTEELKNLRSKYRFLKNPVFIRNYSITIRPNELLNRCPELKKIFDNEDTKIIDYVNFVNKMRIHSHKKVA